MSFAEAQRAIFIDFECLMAIHPSFTIARQAPFAPKRTLDKYATLAGYQVIAAFQNATPAKWIRHTFDQLEATNGNYRQTTQQTRRDWHKLLDYNRHDCLALRHIVLRASREMECGTVGRGPEAGDGIRA